MSSYRQDPKSGRSCCTSSRGSHFVAALAANPAPMACTGFRRGTPTRAPSTSRWHCCHDMNCAFRERRCEQRRLGWPAIHQHAATGRQGCSVASRQEYVHADNRKILGRVDGRSCWCRCRTAHACRWGTCGGRAKRCGLPRNLRCAGNRSPRLAVQEQCPHGYAAGPRAGVPVASPGIGPADPVRRVTKWHTALYQIRLKPTLGASGVRSARAGSG